MNLREYFNCRNRHSSSSTYPSSIWSSGCLARAMMEFLIDIIWAAFLLAFMSLLSHSREFAFPISRKVNSDSYLINFLCFIFFIFCTLFIFRCTFLIQQWKWFLIEFIVLDRKPSTLLAGKGRIRTTLSQSQHISKTKYPPRFGSTR